MYGQSPRVPLLALLVMTALPLVCQSQAAPRRPTTQQQINMANQIGNGNTVIHDAAWYAATILPTQTTTDAVNAAANANSGGRHQNQNVQGVMGQGLTPGQVANAGDAGQVVVGMLGNPDNPQSILGNTELRNTLINGANNPNTITVSGSPPVRQPTRPPGIYTTPLDGSAPQLIVPQTMVVGDRTVNMVGPDGHLTSDGMQVLQQQNAAADAQLQQYQATREQRLAEMRAQNAANGPRSGSAGETVADAAVAAAAEPLQPSLGDPPGYPLARPRAPRPAGNGDAASVGADIAAATAAALEGSGAVRGDGEHMPWDEYTGDMMSEEMQGAVIAAANLGTREGLQAALDTGCPGGPCGSADAFSRGPYDQSQIPSVQSGPLPMFQIGNVPSGQTMTVAELLPIYAGYDPWRVGTVMRSLDLFPPGPSSVGWSLDLYPPTGVSSVGSSLDLYPPTGISSVGWSLDLYPPTGISSAGSSVLWTSLNGNSQPYNGSLSSLVNAFNPMLANAWNNRPGGSLSATELRQIAAGLLSSPNRISQGAVHAGNLTGMADSELLRLATTDIRGLRELLGQPFNVLLTWGAGANDLDLHMTGPLAGNRFHVYYSDQGSLTEAPYAALIRDCICTNGSEVILTSNLLQGGVYRVSVFNYGDQSASSTELPSPGANVVLSIVRGGEAVGVGQGTTIQGGTVLYTGRPSPTGTGNTWRAVEIDPATGRLFSVDTIVQSGGSSSVQ
ncbi:MAG: hypothetical protein WAU48_13085 [Gammaproteobacteria bacterium]